MKKVIVISLAGAALGAVLVNPAWSCDRCDRPDKDIQSFRRVVRVLDAILNEPRHYPRKVVIIQPRRPQVKKICNWRGCRTVWTGPARRYGWGHSKGYAKHQRKGWR